MRKYASIDALYGLACGLTSLSMRNSGYVGHAALVTLAFLCAFSIAAAYSRLILHADGAYFMYAIAAGDSWGLKWGDLSTRAAIYLLAVVPSEAIAHMFQLSGNGIAAVYSFLFYAVPTVQFGVVVWLAWNKFRHLLIYPLIQFGLATGLATGFPTEILFAPGFFWICMLAILCRPVPVILLAVSFVGLLFSHELAILGVIIVVAFFTAEYLRSKDRLGIGVWQTLFFAFSGAAAFFVWLSLRLDGGGRGADSTAMYVFAPRLLIDNPTLWVIIAVFVAALTVFAVARMMKRELPSAFHAAFVVLCVIATIAASYWLNYATGRYLSSRTLIGLAIFGLGILFLVQLYAPAKGESRIRMDLSPLFKMSVSGMLAVNLTALMLFLGDWNTARSAFEKAANAGGDPNTPRIVEFEKAHSLLGDAGVAANKNISFEWSWPFRSIILADNYRPRHIIVPLENVRWLCPRLTHEPRNQVPKEVIDTFRQYACAQPKAPPVVLGRWGHFWNWLGSFL